MTEYLDRKYENMTPGCSLKERFQKEVPHAFEIEEKLTYKLPVNGMPLENISLQNTNFSTDLNHYTFLMEFVSLINHDVKLFSAVCPKVFVHFRSIKLQSSQENVDESMEEDHCYYSEVTLENFPLNIRCSGYGLTSQLAKSAASKHLLEHWGEINLLPNFLLHDISTSAPMPHKYPKITEIVIAFLPILLQHNNLSFEMATNSFFHSPPTEESEKAIPLHRVTFNTTSVADTNACVFFTQEFFPVNDVVVKNIMATYPNKTIIVHPWFISGSDHPYFDRLPKEMKNVILQHELQNYKYIRELVRQEERQKIIDEFPPTVRELLLSQSQKRQETMDRSGAQKS